MYSNAPVLLMYSNAPVLMYNNAPTDLRDISLIYISWYADHTFKKNWLRKLITSTFPMYFPIFDFDYGF